MAVEIEITGIAHDTSGFTAKVRLSKPIFGRIEHAVAVQAGSYGEVPQKVREELEAFARDLLEATEHWKVPGVS